MLSRWPIWYKLLAGVCLLAVIVVALAISSFRGVYAYRQVVRSISQRATELPLASELARDVSDLRVTLSQTRRAHDFAPPGTRPRVDMQILREEFRTNLLSVRESLGRYRERLEENQEADGEFDNHRERETVRRFER